MIFWLRDFLPAAAADRGNIGITTADKKAYFRDVNAYIYSSASGVLDIVATTINLTGTFNLGPIDIAAGTQTVANPMLDATATWNAAGVTFEGLRFVFTDTASAAGSRFLQFRVGATDKFSIDKSGNILTMDGKVKEYAGAAPTNGQVLMGHTANGTLEIGTLTGTANQVTVTNGAGSVTLATPQDIATASTPQFARLGLGGAAGAASKLTLTGGTITTSAPLIVGTQTWNDVAVTFDADSITITDTLSAAASTVLKRVVGAATVFSVGKGGNIATDGKVTEYAGAAPTDGQILMGHTANGTLEIGTLTGTANQVTVTGGAGSITLATPQSIATASTPQFARLGLGGAADAASKLSLTGGTVLVSTPLIVGTQTWNDAAVTFDADSITITSTASAAASTVLKRVVGAATVFAVGKGGNIATDGKVTEYAGAAPTNGQVLMGHTANGTLEIGTLTGTANQVVVTGGAGSVTLSIPQNIDTAATPQFARLGLGGAADAASRLSLTGGTVLTNAPLILGTQTWNDAAVTFDADSLTITSTASAAASTVLKRVVGAATVFAVGKGGNIATDGKVTEYAGAAPTDGQVLMGHTANGTLEIGTLTGTANQVTVTNGAGSVTLATPQNLDTAATVRFGAAGLGVAAGAAGTLKMTAKMLLYNNAAPTDGQLLIGDTAEGAFDAATLTGTASQITVTNGAGSITLSTPQNIATTSTPQFARLGLGAAAGAAALVTGSVGAGEQALAVTQGGATETSGVNLVSLATTWNNAANTPTAIFLNVTDTASNASSKLIDAQVGAASKFSADKAGNLTKAGHWKGQVFNCNTFEYPTASFTPDIEGAGLAASLAAKKVWMRLPFLKQGDVIISYVVKGNVASAGNAVTLDCALYKIAADGTTTAIVNGGMVQVSKVANYNMSEAVNPDDETIATNEMMVLEFTGTTNAGTSIQITGVEVTVDRK